MVAKANAKALRALPKAMLRGRAGGEVPGGASAEAWMAVEMAAEADRHERPKRPFGSRRERRRAGGLARACTQGRQQASCDGWREEVRQNLQAAFERAAARQAGA